MTTMAADAGARAPIPPGYLAAAGAFAASTILIALTGSLPIIAIWLGIWTFTAAATPPRLRLAPLTFLLAVILFYPEFSTAFSSLTEKVVVQTLFLAAFTVWFAPAVLRSAAAFVPLTLVAVYWTIWGVASYVPVAASYALLNHVRIGVPEDLRTFYTETSAIKAALPVLIAPLALFVPLVAIDDERDWRRWLSALKAMAVILLVVSALEYAAGAHAVPFDPSRILHGSSRMEGFSMPDPNGFARLLLMPVLLLAAAVVFSPGTTGPIGWLAFAGAIAAIAMTQSRTAYVSITAGLAVLGLLSIRRRRTVLLGLTGLAAVAFAFVVLDVRSAFAAGSERLTLTSLVLRMELWQGVLAILRENPWFGAHPGGYAIRLLQMGYPPWRIHSPHNLYLYLGAEWGVPMMLLCLALQIMTAGYAIAVLRRTGVRPVLKAAAAGCLALTVTYAVHGITETVPPVFLFLVAGLIASVHRVVRREAC
jgi:O-antigen ligase